MVLFYFPDTTCFDWTGVKVLVVVQTAPEFWRRRQGIRETWMKSKYPDIKVVFMFGKSDNSERAQQALTVEQEVHCDMIQMDFIGKFKPNPPGLFHIVMTGK